MTEEERVATIELLRGVEYFASLDAETLTVLAARARRARYRRGDRLMTELEAGADVFVVVAGNVEVSVEPRAGEKRVLGTLGPGGVCGEMSSLTGELRSASVTALGEVQALVIADEDFDRLRERRPEVALVLVRVLAARLAAAERSIDAFFSAPVAPPSVSNDAAGRRGSIGRAWRELVVSRRRDLAFLTLAAFVTALVAVRLAVYLSFRFDWAPRDVLRVAYMTGFASLAVSACAALLTFRPAWRRVIAVAYGLGCALIFNELGVTLAFDIFYKDIHTPDPTLAFDVERLYRRTEPLRAVAIALVVLLQLAYLRPFYRRAFFVARTRLRKLLSRSRA